MEIFEMGGLLFMTLITIPFVAGLALAVRIALMIWVSKSEKTAIRQNLSLLKSVGLFTLVMGVLGQMIGLYTAFEAIEAVGEVSQSLLAGGLKISSITTIYGLICFVITYLIYFLLGSFVKS